jgi:hypothetical protein
VSGQVDQIRDIVHFDERVQTYSHKSYQEVRKSITGMGLTGEKHFPQ